LSQRALNRAPLARQRASCPRVAGTWRHRDGRIELRPFERLDAGARRELEAEGERLAELHA